MRLVLVTMLGYEVNVSHCVEVATTAYWRWLVFFGTQRQNIFFFFDKNMV